MLDDGTYKDAMDYADAENTLVCNFGDFMSSLTEGRVRSPWHRVA